jgi:PAS domain S-box-containing protein
MKHSVLYIDDENNNLISFKLQFKEYYNIFTSSSAKDGFEILKRNNIDVIIADQQMPEMTGVEFFEQVHKEFPHIPRLILTGFSDTETVIDGINKGKIFHYLQKPWNKTLLKMAISNALKSTKLWKKNVQLAKDLKIANQNLKTQNKQLKISAKKLSNAQALAHIGNWELDFSKNKLNWSEEIYRIFEIDPKKFKATYEAFLDIIHPDDREMVDKAYTKSLKTKQKKYEIIHRIKLKNGTIKYVSEKSITKFDENGKPLLSLGTIQDITERKKAEKKLKKSEEKYYGMIQNLMEGFYNTQLDGKLLDYNPEFVRILGLDPNKNHMGIKLPNFWQNPEDRKYYVEKLIKNGFIKNYRANAKKLDGEKMVCQINSILIKNEEGNPLRIEGTFIDITKRLRAEDEIRKLNKNLEDRVQKRTEELSHEKYFSEAVINSLPGIFSLIDTDGNHIRWNKNHQEVTGYSPEEYKHMKAFDFFSEANKKIIWEEMAQLNTNNEISIEADLLTKSSKEIPYFFTGINVSINNKKYLAGMGFDISERKLSEAELRKKTEELEIFNKSMIDRELRIIEMKEEVNKLLLQLGLGPQYPEVWKK